MGTALIAGCASPTVVQAVKPSDYLLTCPQIINEYAKLETYRAEAESEKGLTGAMSFGHYFSGLPLLAHI